MKKRQAVHDGFGIQLIMGYVFVYIHLTHGLTCKATCKGRVSPYSLCHYNTIPPPQPCYITTVGRLSMVSLAPRRVGQPLGRGTRSGGGRQVVIGRQRDSA